MNALTIRRWHSRYRSAAPLHAGLLRDWDGALAALDPPRALGAAPDELVFVRRLRISTRLGEHNGQAQAAELWSAALERALSAGLADAAGTNVVRYRCRRDAVADMLYRACSGDASRDWVWAQMGLVPDGACGAERAMRAAAGEMLREPAAIWPTLARMILAEPRTGSLTMMLQHLPNAELARLLLACPQSAEYQQAADGALPEAGPFTAPPKSVLVQPLMAWAASHAGAATRSRRTLIVLLAAAGWPARRLSAAPILAVLAACGASLDQARPGHTSARQPRERAEAAAVNWETPAPGSPPLDPIEKAQSYAALDGTRGGALAWQDIDDGGDLPAAPPLDDIAVREPSAWAGLLFLLHLLPASGLLEQVDGGALPPVLWHVATAMLGVPAADPAVRAFCGGWQPEAHLVDEHGALALPATLAEPAAQCARFLHRAVSERLYGIGLAEVCRRSGSIEFEPGWIELHLPLHSAQAALRRAAFDLDPGWLPWLGCVLRFVYE